MNNIPASDRDILRELGRQIAAAAADPVNEERRAAQHRLDGRERGRPSIRIYQEPWSELNGAGELDLRCCEPFCRAIEQELRRTLYRWRYYPGDMVIESVSIQPCCVDDSGFGIEEDTDVVHTDPANNVISRQFHIQIRDESDLTKIRPPIVRHDAAKTEEQFAARAAIFDGILDVRKEGRRSFWFAPWDDLVRWTGVQEALLDMALRPDYVHRIISRLVDCWLERLDQYEAQGLLAMPAREMTVSGAAQIFAEVSPAMHREFALQHEARFYRRFARVYYGCCEPLHDKVDICAECLPNLYKLSISPWANFAVAVRNVRDRFVFAWKPNPAFLAHDTWNPALIRADLREKLAMAADGGCILEIHLKDISTVRHQPERLTEWNRIAKEESARFGV